MPIDRKTSNTLLIHQHATIGCLRERLELLWSLVQQHNRGVAPKVICRRFKVTPAELKSLLAEHARFAKYVHMARRIGNKGGLMKGDRTSWAKFTREVKKEEKFTRSAAGIKKTLAKNPRKATMRKALHLYYVIEGVVYGGWKPITDPKKLTAGIKLGRN